MQGFVDWHGFNPGSSLRLQSSSHKDSTPHVERNPSAQRVLLVCQYHNAAKITGRHFSKSYPLPECFGKVLAGKLAIELRSVLALTALLGGPPPSGRGWGQLLRILGCGFGIQGRERHSAKEEPLGIADFVS